MQYSNKPIFGNDDAQTYQSAVSAADSREDPIADLYRFVGLCRCVLQAPTAETGKGIGHTTEQQVG